MGSRAGRGAASPGVLPDLFDLPTGGPRPGWSRECDHCGEALGREKVAAIVAPESIGGGVWGFLHDHVCKGVWYSEHAGAESAFQIRPVL